MEQLAWNVQNYSQQIALIDEKGSMTYKEMDELSDAVAVSIRKAGVGSSAIALLMSASNECIVTMLGILKAGCCFVPLDVELPEERRKFILQDAGCVMLFDRTNYPFGEVIDENIVSHKKMLYRESLILFIHPERQECLKGFLSLVRHWIS